MELDNKIIGRNIAKFRKLRDMKASEVAEKLSLSEAAYTKYERGETAITIDILQKVAEIINVDPINILSVNPGNFIESIQNSPNAGNYVGGNFLTSNEQQTQMMLTLMQQMITLNERLITVIDKK